MKSIYSEVHFSFMDELWKRKMEIAVERIRLATPTVPLIVAHSGGKDSVVISRLADMSGRTHRKIYNVTTIDPPELVRFVRTCGVEMIHPRINFVRMIEKKGLPTRWCRWCCEKFKHGVRVPGTQIIGVRSQESLARKNFWKTVNFKDGEYVICPILDWSTEDVWRFIREQGLRYCELYDLGWKRIGCMGCPLSGKPILELRRYPRVMELMRSAWMKYCSTHDSVRDPSVIWESWLTTGKFPGEAAPETECQMDYLKT